MKTKNTILTKEEHDILILCALNQNGEYLSNAEIGQRVGMSAIGVNTVIHNIYAKLGVHDRNEAVLSGLKKGEIALTDIWSLDELAGTFRSLDPDTLTRIADIINQELEYKQLFEKDEQTTPTQKDSLLIDREGTGSDLLKTKDAVLTKEERDILILSGLNQNGKHLSNTEIGQRLGISANKVNTAAHQACIKLGAHSKGRAINLALKQREIILTDIWSLDELAEIFSSLGPDMLRRIANVLRHGLKHKHLLEKNERIVIIGRRQDGILTSRERDVVILAGPGLTNKEVAERLYISIGSVRIFLNRACRKLGVSRRSEVFVLALKKREISVADVYPLNEVMTYLAPLGVESIEQMAQMME